MSKMVLEGITVLDMTLAESGTVATMALSLLGATVYHIYRPGAANIGSRYRGEVLRNLNKTNMTINGKVPEGAENFWRLIEQADIVVTQSSEAIVSTTASITVRAGKLHLCALDEGLESVGNMILSGGQIWIQGEGGGISCDKKLSVTGGTIFIDGPTGGDGGIVELNLGNGVTGTWNQTDGMLIGLGNPSEENQPTSRSEGRVLHIEGTFTAGTIYAVREQGGENVAVFTPSHDSEVLLIALPMSAKGKTYEILSGVETDGKPSYGFYDAENSKGGTVLLTVTANDVYTEAVIS